MPETTTVTAPPAATTTATTTTAPVTPPAPAKTWDEVLKGMPEDVQKLYNEHTQGLQNTVKATREERDTLRSQVADALKKAEKGSELETTLTDTLVKLDAATKRSDFIEEGIKPEIGCHNLKAAFAVATAQDLFKKSGAPDWDAIKKEVPELFGPIIPNANGGDGTQTPQAPVDMNSRIRAAAAK